MPTFRVIHRGDPGIRRSGETSGETSESIVQGGCSTGLFPVNAFNPDLTAPLIEGLYEADSLNVSLPDRKSAGWSMAGVASSRFTSEEPDTGRGTPAAPAGFSASEAQSAAATGSGLVIQLVYEANALAAPQSFRDGMQTAVNLLEAAIHDNITVNIDVSYGTFGNVLLPNQNTSEGNIGYTGNGTNGIGITESYANLRTLLFDSATSAVDAESVAVLPNTTSLQGRSSFTIGTAQAKALGVFPASASIIDGQVGIGTAFTGNVLVSAALHEITHAMGRINGDRLDLFRYSSPGIHLFGEGTLAPPAYFSIDGGITDLADFGINSDPGDFLNPPGSNRTPNDPFDEIVGNLGALTSADLREMDVLGFNVTTSPTSPTPSPDLPWQTDGTSIFLQSDSGPVAIWTVSGTAFAGGGIVGNPGPSWHAKAPGDFNGDGRPDILWQNDSGEVAIWELNGTAVVGGGSLGNPGPSWQVGSVGDFNGDGRSDVLWRNGSGDV